MDEPGSLEALQLLHKDLLALSESRFNVVDRLEIQLQTHVEEFRKLLDKPSRNNASRQKLSTGKVELRDEEYEINQEFQQGALQLADALDLDEIQAAQIFLDAQNDAATLGRSQLDSSIIRFHRRREYLLECLRIALELGKSASEGLPESLQQWIGMIANSPQGNSAYFQKCLQSMVDCRTWLQNLTDKVNSASVLGQASQFSEIEQWQRRSLVRQHELLAVIIFYLIKSNRTGLNEFGLLLNAIKRIDKYDNLLVHYFLALGASIQACVRLADGSQYSLENLRPLHERLFTRRDDQAWPLQYVYAAITSFWLSEYCAWYDDSNAHDPHLANLDVPQIRTTLTKAFQDAIREGAFDFLMSMCAEVKPLSWQDPAQHEIYEWIDHKGGTLSLPWQRIEYTARSALPGKDFLTYPLQFETWFQTPFMEQMEVFVDSCIENAPNVLRTVRQDENEQRQLGQIYDYGMNLEKFLVIISFAFEGRPNAAMREFWSEVPSAPPRGFLEWVSTRASTALASAFNGALRSLACDPESALAAHRFLLDESSTSSGKMRKLQCLNWDLILSELKHLTAKLSESPALLHANLYRPGKPHGDHDETEALAAEANLQFLLLQSCLHLITRLCTHSSEARKFLLESASINIIEQLFRLISIPTPQLPSVIRGCAFQALESLTKQKTRSLSDDMWNCLVRWKNGYYSIPSGPSKVSAENLAYNSTIDRVLTDIEVGFDQPNAFVQLLNSLIIPEEDGDLNDTLPFPETLGSSAGMPGICDFVDFVMRVFKNKTFDKSSPRKSQDELKEMRILRYTCLNFISTCLATFNEDLLIFAEQPQNQVDNAIRSSNLENYVRFHPFARVMEWVFGDSVMEALFAAVEQDYEEVGNAEPDSPLVLSLLEGINVICKILDMQQTYLNRVRPSIRKIATYRYASVSSVAYGSLEDGLLKHLSIIANLASYCTYPIDRSDLPIASLRLLEKLCTSSKLISSLGIGPDRRMDRNKLVVALEENGETENISTALMECLEPDEFDENPNSPRYGLASNILRFLNACVEFLPNRPTVAHLLLGFRCLADALDVDDNSPLGQQTSLFHKILELSVRLPAHTSENCVSSSLISIKNSCLQLLRSLWSSPLSLGFVTGQLRAWHFLTHLIIKEPIVRADTLWDGLMKSHPDFMVSSSATALTNFLVHRASIFKFISIELRLLAADRAPTWKQAIVNTLLGSTRLPEGENINNSNVFDFFDFMELEIDGQLERPNLHYLSGIDLRMCVEVNGANESFNVDKASELIALRIRELENANQIPSSRDLQLELKRIQDVGQVMGQELDNQVDIANQVGTERTQLLLFLQQMNHLQALQAARSLALQAWVQLMCMMIESGDLGQNKMEFVLQAFQLILPKLEKYSTENLPAAIDLARLAKTLLFSLDLGNSQKQNSTAGIADGDASQRKDATARAMQEKRNLMEMANERLFSLFRISIRAINTTAATAQFKQIFYSICYKYLTGIIRNTAVSAIAQRRQCLKIIKLSGDRLLEILCDDAHGGEQQSRVAALLLLNALIKLARQVEEREQEESKFVIQSLGQFNFIGILVDSIQNIPSELRDTSEQDTSSQVTYCKAKLSLLLQIAQTRYGASQILNARLFRSVQNSGLFSMDPDLGLDIVIPNQDKVYYELLLAIMRIINACVVSRGAQNEQTLEDGRKFVRESRTAMMTVMKKHAGIGAVDNGLELDIGDLAEAFMLLISVTDFMKSEEKVTRSKKPKVFT